MVNAGVTSELVERLRAVMPEQSTVDLDRHARAIAEAVTRARAARSHELVAALTRRISERSDDLDR
jgi:hypothetical protein